MKIAWLLGWAVPEAWFAPLAQKAFSNAEHVFIAATSAALERLHAAAPFDQIVGYSLGAHLLLTSSAPFPHVALLAPFFAFSAEEKFGGRVARGQLRYLARWLRSDPAAALADFYFRSGLDVPASLAPVSTQQDLLWGLEQLEKSRAAPKLPAGWRAWCGANDALLDAERLHKLCPQINLVPRATHHPAELLRALAENSP